MTLRYKVWVQFHERSNPRFNFKNFSSTRRGLYGIWACGRKPGSTVDYGLQIHVGP